MQARGWEFKKQLDYLSQPKSSKLKWDYGPSADDQNKVEAQTPVKKIVEVATSFQKVISIERSKEMPKEFNGDDDGLFDGLDEDA